MSNEREVNSSKRVKAPEFTLPDVNGDSVSLYKVLNSGHKVLLVFLRHLGWLVCAEHVAQLCERKKELSELNVEVILISFGPQEKGKDWLKEVCDSFQLLIDPERVAYRTYKLKHSWLSSWNLKTLAYYIRALLEGRGWRGITGDSAQLGGDFIINNDGALLLEYRSKEATDRPEVSELVSLLREYSQ